MAKTEKVKLVATECVGTTLQFKRAATKETFATLAVGQLSPKTLMDCAIYGAKQVCADVAASLEGEARFAAIQKAAESLQAGIWPTRKTEASADELMAKLQLLAKADPDVWAKLAELQKQGFAK